MEWVQFVHYNQTQHIQGYSTYDFGTDLDIRLEVRRPNALQIEHPRSVTREGSSYEKIQVVLKITPMSIQ